MINEENLFPSLLFANYYNSRKDCKSSPPRERTTICCEICVYLENSGSVVINGVEHKIKRGDIRFNPEGVKVYSYLPISCYTLRVKMADCAILNNIPSFFYGGEQFIDAFKEIIELFEATEAGIKLLMNSRLLRLLYKLNALNTPKICKPVKLCMEYIENHCERKILLEDLGKLSGYNQLYLARLFKSQVGKTPREYQTSVRLNKAANLLENTDKSIDEIAAILGFASTSNFHTLFKAERKISPGKFRKNASY